MHSFTRRNLKEIVIFLSLLLIYSLFVVGVALIAKIPIISLAAIYMFTPLFATLTFCWLFKIKVKELSPKIFTGDYFLFAIGIALLLSLGSLCISILFGYPFSATMSGLIQYGYKKTYLDFIIGGNGALQLFLTQIISAILFGTTINAVFAFCEEIAWRGLLYCKLKNIGFWRMSLVVGFIWGLWHFPLIVAGHNYPVHNKIGVVFMIVFCILLTPILMFIRKESSSLMIPSVMHGTINAAATISVAFLSVQNDLITGITGVTGFILLLLVNIALFIASEKRLIKL